MARSPMGEGHYQERTLKRLTDPPAYAARNEAKNNVVTQVGTSVHKRLS